MPFKIVRQDITKIKVDAIVNAANTELKMGGGVCGAIFRAAGSEKLELICDRLAPIKTGEAVITPGFNLPAKYIIHTAGPVYSERNKEKSAELLSLAYENSLKLAIENKLESIAFPLISSGIYGYPKDEAINIATTTIKEFIDKNDIEVTLVVFGDESFNVSKELLGEVESYLNENLVSFHEHRRRLIDVELKTLEKYSDFILMKEKSIKEPSLDDLIGNLDESFTTMLFRLIDAKGMNDVDVYKGANIDRKLFSKIRNGKEYKTKKKTVIALAISMNLNLNETEELLKRAGYALSRADKFDVIIEYFIVNKIYDVMKINEVLFEYDQQLLGS